MNLKNPDWRDIMAMTPVQLAHWGEQVDAEHSRRIYDGDLETAAELKAAGWTPEPLRGASAMFQWRWRRPGPRGGTLFLSPTMALTALRKAKAKKTTVPQRPTSPG
jgi:hypothetical protein